MDHRQSRRRTWRWRDFKTDARRSLSPDYSYWSGEIVSLRPQGPLRFGPTIYLLQFFLRELFAPFIPEGILGVGHLLAPVKKTDGIRLSRFLGLAQCTIPFRRRPAPTVAPAVCHRSPYWSPWTATGAGPRFGREFSKRTDESPERFVL